MPRYFLHRTASLALPLAALSTPTLAHPGRGIVVNNANEVFVADAVRSVVWKIDATGHISAAARDLHAHWLSLADDGSVLADHLWYEAASDTYPRGLKRIAPHGRVETIIEPKADPHGLDAGAFAALPTGIAIARDSNLHLAFKDTPTSRPEIDLRPFPAGAAANSTVNSLIDLPDASLIALRARTMLEIKDGVARELLTIPPASPPKEGQRPAQLWGLAADDAGHFYTADHDAGAIYKLSKNDAGEWSHTTIFTSESPWFPTGVFIKGDTTYILEHALDASNQNLGPRVQTIKPGQPPRVLATVTDR